MTKHTPGPWKVARQGISPGWLVYSDFEREKAGATHYVAQNLTHEADARLIAAAPEILESLWEIVRAFVLQTDKVGLLHPQFIHEARVLLAKIDQYKEGKHNALPSS